MKDIEIQNTEAGPTVSFDSCDLHLDHPVDSFPRDAQVNFTGDAQNAAAGKTVKVSISHSDSTVVAFAVTQ